jgi:hypothetical protein
LEFRNFDPGICISRRISGKLPIQCDPFHGKLQKLLFLARYGKRADPSPYESGFLQRKRDGFHNPPLINISVYNSVLNRGNSERHFLLQFCIHSSSGSGWGCIRLPENTFKKLFFPQIPVQFWNNIEHFRPEKKYLSWGRNGDICPFMGKLWGSFSCQ